MPKQGRGQGKGQGPKNPGGGGRGGGGGGFGLGPNGLCVCPRCGYEQGHQLGLPCYEQKCPECGSPMTRLR